MYPHHGSEIIHLSLDMLGTALVKQLLFLHQIWLILYMYIYVDFIFIHRLDVSWSSLFYVHFCSYRVQVRSMKVAIESNQIQYFSTAGLMY